MNTFKNGDTVTCDTNTGGYVEGTVVRAYKTKIRVDLGNGSIESFPIENVHSQADMEAAEAEADRMLEERGLTDMNTDDTEAELEDEAQNEMSRVMLKYRKKYVPSVSASQRKSLNNGDDLAKLLEYKDHKQVIAIAEIVGNFNNGELLGRYSHLNNGQQRMTAGNRIRALIKKGEITIDDVKAAIAAL